MLNSWRAPARAALESYVPICLALATVWLMYVSLAWGLNQDAPLLVFVAQLMERDGLVPYLDIFEMNAPGTHLLHQGLFKLAGNSERGWRLIDVFWLLATQLSMFAYLRRWGWQAGVTGAALFSLHYLYTFSNSLQREYFCILPLCLSLIVALRLPRWPIWLRSFIVGLLFGAIITIKPPLALACPFVLGGLIADTSIRTGSADCLSWRGLRSSARWIVPALLGLAVVPGLCAIYLLSHGAWDAFREMSREYWPLYAQLRGDGTVRGEPFELRRLSELARALRRFSFLPIAAIGLYLGVPRLWRQGGRDRVDLTVILANLAVAAGYIYLSGKFWLYHTLPLAFVYSLVGALALAPTRTKQSLGGVAFRSAILAFLLLMTWQQPILRGQPNRIDSDVDSLAALLGNRLKPGETVQPLGATGGTVHAMLLAEARLATPFLYDFHFYHPDVPIINRLRKRFLRAMEEAQPRFVIADHGFSWRPRGRGTAKGFPELDTLLSTRYKIVWRGQRLLLYELRAAGP